MQHWTDPPVRPSRPIGIALGLIAIGAMLLIALVAFAGKAGASPPVSRCGGPCPTYPTTTGATTTAATTTTAPSTTLPPPTTAPPTTVCSDCTPTQQTTVPPTTAPPGIPFCVPDPAFPNRMCLNIFTPGTTVPAATTTAAPTTTQAPATTTPAAADPVADTTAVDQTLPPAVVTAPPTGSPELPHTGTSLWLAALAVALLGLGGFALAAKRVPRRGA